MGRSVCFDVSSANFVMKAKGEVAPSFTTQLITPPAFTTPRACPHFPSTTKQKIIPQIFRIFFLFNQQQT
jgi:hypothetical protein